MPRKAIGEVVEHAWKDGRTITYGARFHANGRRERVQFGTNHQGWSRQRAEVELERILAQVERGTWQREATEPETETLAMKRETLHVTASRWWQRHSAQLAKSTKADYRWRLDHILKQLAGIKTSEIDVKRVDSFREKLRRGGLSPRSVNMVLDVLAQILDDAVEYEMLAQNPARGKRRRMKVPKQPRSFLEPDMVIDLLNAAGSWEAELPPHQHYGRRAFLATLCLAGPRISELLEAPRGRLDLEAGALVLGRKTAAGRDRHLDLTAMLLEELAAHTTLVPLRLGGLHLSSQPVFPTRSGGALNPSNIRNRLLPEAVRRANVKRAGEGRMLLPERLTPHALRRTFASLCFFAGRDLRYVMGQLGHDDPRMTLGVYAQAMKRRDVDDALVWRLMRFPDEPSARADSS